MADNDSSSLYEYITDSGVVMPNTDTVKADVEATYRDTFGNGIDLTAESVGGRLVERDTSALTQTVRVVAQNANQFNPHYATGAYLDHLANMFGFSRQRATNTRVYATLTGTSGTVVPMGSLAQTANGDAFASEAAIEIGNTGGSGWFVAVNSGAVPCGIGELNSVQSSVNGWNGISNQYDSVSASLSTVIGTDTETDEHLRARLLQSVWSGTGFVKTIEARVAEIPGVASCVVLENNGSQPRIERGVTIPPHSVFVGVDGGENTAVAKAIYASRSVGCGYTTTIDEQGATVTVVPIADETNGVTHNVYFQRPVVDDDIEVTITVKPRGYGGADLDKAILDAINGYLSALPIGGDVTDYGMAEAVSAALPEIKVLAVTIVGLDSVIPAYRKYELDEENLSVVRRNGD